MDISRLSSLVFTSFWISAGLILLVLNTGCGTDPCDPRTYDREACFASWTSTDTAQTDVGGFDGTVIDMPFPVGTDWRCTQGVDGSYSHTANSTQNDLDLDTSNSDSQAVYASVGGVAYVHTESATANFGYHVNIQFEDGSYVVLAHMSEIFVADDEEVAAGQLLGYEGCTGACSGDHVHVGVHEGDGADMAQYGTSVEVAFYAADMDEEEPVLSEIAASDFVCSTSTGHVYESGLETIAWHPDGSLVMVSGDPKVYVVEDGVARWIENETVFWSHGFDFDEVTRISSDELSCLGTGSDITTEGSVDAGYDEDGDAWLLVTDTDGDDWKQELPSDGADEVLVSWGFSGDLGMDPELSESRLDGYEMRSGEAVFRDGTILKESSRSDVYIVSDGIALPVKDWDTYLLLGFSSRSITTVDDGLIEDVFGDSVGSCTAGIWCLDKEAVTTCGGGLELGSGSESGGEEVADEESEEESDADTDADTDSDTDSDSDADTDADSDSDSDTDTDTESVDTGSESETETETEDTAVTEEEEVEEVEEEELDPEDTDEYSDYIWIDGDDLCFSADGFAFPYDGADAYMVGYGGTSLNLDFTFQAEFELSNVGDAYCLDTSTLDFDDYEATLVSSLNSSGGSATSYADTGDWWDNYDLCTSGTSTMDQFCAYQGGWDYLIAFSVSSSGLIANGDGV